MHNFNDDIHLEGSKRKTIFVPVNDEVTLKVILFTPEIPEINTPVIMVTGLVTIMESFYEVIAFLTRRLPVIYVETREKTSSQIEGKVSFGIKEQGFDLVSIVKFLGLKNNEYFMLGYSFGATIIAQSYKFLTQKPRGIIFLEPTPVFYYPKWSLSLIKMCSPRLYFILKPFAKWYLKNFQINKKEDNEMAVISSKSLDNADPYKLKKVILDIAGYRVWEMLEFIDCPALVVGTSKDGLHVKEDVMKMVNTIEKSRFVDLETNQRTHSAEMGEIAFSFFKEL